MKSVVVYSGGLDSTVLLYHLLAQGVNCHALSVNYGQRHRCELDAAEQITKQLGVPHRIVDLSGLAELMPGSALTDASVSVPEGHYTDASMAQTVVPNRNMLLLATAAAWAIALKADSVAYAAHHGDHAIYPDCRPAFADALDVAIQMADTHRVALHRPFIGMSKADIVQRGAELDVPFAATWSCYKGGALHCGRCGTCIERREAFYVSQIPDPTPYAADAPSVKDLVASNWQL